MEKEFFDWTLPEAIDALERSFSAKKPIFSIQREEDLQSQAQETSGPVAKTEKKRHGNSLKKICTRILRYYHHKEDCEIFLNEFSVRLNIERRRIYDIVNILEALDIVVKKSKNVYLWKSIHLFTTKLRILNAAGNALAGQLKLFYFETRPMTSKKKMLTYLTLKVLKLFYTTKSVLSFSEIMKICEEHYIQVQQSIPLADTAEFESKNRIRRLYDIINVFKALGLISKISSKSDKKIYIWQGEAGFSGQVAKLSSAENQETAPSKCDTMALSEDLHLGKRVENSAFRLCQQFQDHEYCNIKNVLTVKGQIPPRKNTV